MGKELTAAMTKEDAEAFVASIREKQQDLRRMLLDLRHMPVPPEELRQITDEVDGILGGYGDE